MSHLFSFQTTETKVKSRDLLVHLLLSFSDDDFCLVTTIHNISSCRKGTIMTHPSHDSLPKLTTEGVFSLSLSCSQAHATIDDVKIVIIHTDDSNPIINGDLSI
jgi:hypothetical protein